MITYNDLEDRGGTIFNKRTMTPYSRQEDLARDLGVAPHQIQWANIPKSNMGYGARAIPTPTPTPTPTPEPTQQPTGNPIVDNAIKRLNDMGDEQSTAFASLLAENKKYLDELQKRGQMLNPNVEITKEKTAEFLTQAQGEISPYYNTQMKMARENLLRSAGYTTDEIMRNEAEIEKKYGQGVRQIGETMAESGFAQSGRRIEGEQNLAEETQSTIDANRRRAEFEMGNQARQFAGEWGGVDMPSVSYQASPRVLAGVGSFAKTSETKPFYNISDSVYQGLKGSRQYEQDVAEKQRTSELEGLYRTTEENRLRKLNL